VREAKALEEAGDLLGALARYEEMRPLKPDLESVPKKIRSLRKKIAAAAAAGDGAAAASSSSHAASSSSAAAEPCMLPIVLEGKFAFDARKDVYTLLRLPAHDAPDETVELDTIQRAGQVLSTSPLLSNFSIPSVRHKSNTTHARGMFVMRGHAIHGPVLCVSLCPFPVPAALHPYLPLPSGRTALALLAGPCPCQTSCGVCRR
jgi:hypothetical protein